MSRRKKSETVLPLELKDKSQSGSDDQESQSSRRSSFPEFCISNTEGGSLSDCIGTDQVSSFNELNVVEPTPMSLGPNEDEPSDICSAHTSLDGQLYLDKSFHTYDDELVETSENLTPSDSLSYQDTNPVEGGNLSPKIDHSVVYRRFGNPSNQPGTIQSFPFTRPPTSLTESPAQESSIGSLFGSHSLVNFDVGQIEQYIEGDKALHEGTIINDAPPHLSILELPELSNEDFLSSFDTRNIIRRGCLCLEAVISLTNDLEPETDPNKVLAKHELDTALDRHKKAVRQGEALVQCLTCSKLPRNRITVELLVDRLLLFCEKIIVSYLTGGGSEALLKKGNFVLGDFKVDGNVEYDLLLGSLIALQLQSLMSLVEQVEGAEGPFVSRVKAAKSRMQAMRQLLELRWPNRILAD